MVKTPRTIFLIAFFCISLILVSALYLQFVEYYEPCPLCIMERLLLLIIAIILFIGTCHNPTRKAYRVYNAFIAFFASLGGYFAGYQVWIQSFQINKIVNSCAPSLKVLREYAPLKVILPDLFHSCGQCSIKANWQWLGLSLASWTLLFFMLILSFAILQFFKK